MTLAPEDVKVVTEAVMLDKVGRGGGEIGGRWGSGWGVGGGG